MNSTEIFTLALGLKEPWEIKDVEISTGQDSVKELHIHLGFKRGAKFEDEEGVSCSVHDTQTKTWRHLNFFEHTCMLHCECNPFSAPDLDEKPYRKWGRQVPSTSLMILREVVSRI